MPDSNLSQTLFTAAEAYLSLGYSVIPVWGMADPARPKVAGVEWAIFQRRRPTLAEIKKWFLESDFGGIAIVTGRISGLAVLDFDTPEGFRDFSAQYPDLVATHVIQTRRGFHIYFHLPPHLQLSSRKGQGVDLLANGRYVVARPTCIDGHTYKLIRGGQPKTLIAFDVERITRFLDELGGAIATHAPEPQVTAFSFDSKPIQSSYREPQKPVITANDLKGLYQGLLAKGLGRNDTLFQVSLKARDEGWTAEQTSASLTDLHVWQPAIDHRHETPAQRYIEARKTVQSAFSRPARAQKTPANAKQAQIPNSVREHLCKLGQTRTFRVLDGLRLQGVTPGMLFTTKQALELLKGIVGRDSIYVALKSTTSSGQRFFEQQNPSPVPPTPANAATDTKTDPNKCLFVGAKKSGISPNHRPATVYKMPSNDELCSRLEVKNTGSDPLTLDDLCSVKQTRMALHRELIQRRPANYTRRWLAGRLGVSRETLDTYNAEIEGLHSRPCFWEQRVYWSNLKIVPDGIQVKEAFLEDETGKRYPARQPIAARLLGQGRKIVYKRQDANFYWYGDVMPNLEGKSDPRAREAHPQPTRPLIRHYTIPREQSLPRKSETPPRQHTEHFKPADSTTIAQPLDCRKPLPSESQESLAMRVYDILDTQSRDMAERISKVTARRLVHRYGSHAVAQALELLTQRKNVIQPAGFLVTILRSDSKR